MNGFSSTLPEYAPPNKKTLGLKMEYCVVRTTIPSSSSARAFPSGTGNRTRNKIRNKEKNPDRAAVVISKNFVVLLIPLEAGRGQQTVTRPDYVIKFYMF